jgi:L-fuconolactonase
VRPTRPPQRTVDAHLHLWDLDVSDYAWLTPQHGALHATFTADVARTALNLAGIGSAVLVQAEDSARDTQFMLDAASRHSWIVGVVGWVRLDDPPEAEQQLQQWRGHPAFCGVRHLVHEDPRENFLSLPSVRRSLKMLADNDIAFDVPDAWPRHLAATATLAAELPTLRIVLDHLGKPPRAPAEHRRWLHELRPLAAQPNTVAKVSGLQLPGEPFTVAALRPVWDTALELFGPARLMYGGDWPLTLPYGGYGPTWQVMSELIGELSEGEQELLLAGTAGTVYRLPCSPDPTAGTQR